MRQSVPITPPHNHQPMKISSLLFLKFSQIMWKIHRKRMKIQPPLDKQSNYYGNEKTHRIEEVFGGASANHWVRQAPSFSVPASVMNLNIMENQLISLWRITLIIDWCNRPKSIISINLQRYNYSLSQWQVFGSFVWNTLVLSDRICYNLQFYKMFD